MQRCLLRNTFILSASLLIAAAPAAASSSVKEAMALKRVYEFWKEEDLLSSKAEALHFLERYPHSIHTDNMHALLADIYLHEKNFKLAFSALENIESIEKKKEIYYHRAICLYELEMYDALVDFASKTLALNPPVEEKETVELFLARALLKKAEHAENTKAKKTLQKLALQHFEHLLKGKYREHALPVAAELSLFLEHYSSACSHLQDLLEILPEEREKILYNLALAQLGNKKKAAAVKTLSSVYKLRGAKACAASLLQLQTLYDEKKYKELLLYQEEALRHINGDASPAAHDLVGSALFFLQEYGPACDHLALALEGASLKEQRKSQIVKQLVLCYGKTKNTTMLEHLLASHHALVLTDEEKGEGHILAFSLCLQQDLDVATAHLVKAIALNPGHTDITKRTIELAHLYHRQGNYSEVENLCRQLLTSQANDKDRCQAAKILLSAAIDSLQTSRPLAVESLLRWALQQPMLLTAGEKKIILYNLFQLQLQQQQLASASQTLKDLEEQGFVREKLFDAFYCLAKAHASDADSTLYTTLLTQALSYQDEEEKKVPLYIALYNSYIFSAKQVDDAKEKKLHLTAATNALFAAYDAGYSMPTKTKHWLAQQLYTLASNNLEGTAYAIKAKGVLEDLLQIRCYPPRLTITRENLDDEIQVLRLAKVLEILALDNEKLDTLETLVQLHSERATWPWRYERQALFALGSGYSLYNKPEEALKSFTRLIEKTTTSYSKLAMLAKLERAKISFNLLKLGNELNAHDISQDLKDLEIYRKLQSEPVHLEAALTYIDLKAYQAVDGQTKKIEMLAKLKKELSDKTDPSVALYLSYADKYPYQDKIRLAYIDYIDAYLLLATAEKEDSPLQKDRMQQAASLLQKIQQLQPMPDTLSLRIKEISP